MEELNGYTEEQLREAYEDTLEDIGGCCIPWEHPFEDVNGICPECGRATVYGEAAAGCCYSPVVCEECGARPCKVV